MERLRDWCPDLQRALRPLANDAVVAGDEPHVPRERGRRHQARASQFCLPCHPRATSSGHERYPADSHGHLDEASRLGAGLSPGVREQAETAWHASARAIRSLRPGRLPKPQRRRGRLHSVGTDNQQLLRQRIQVDLIAESMAERFNGLGGVVLAAVEASIDYRLDAAAGWLEQGSHGQGWPRPPPSSGDLRPPRRTAGQRRGRHRHRRHRAGRCPGQAMSRPRGGGRAGRPVVGAPPPRAYRPPPNSRGRGPAGRP